MPAAASSVSVDIVASFAAFKQALDQAAGATKDFADKVKTNLEGLTAPFEKIQSLILGIGALAAGGAAFHDIVSSTLEATKAVTDLQHALGLNLEQANATNATLKLMGVATNDYIGFALRLDRQIRQNNQSLQQMGFTARDLDLGQKGLIDKAITKLLEYKEGVDRNIASQVLFGRNVQEIYPLLRTHLDGAAERAHALEERLGLTITEGDKARAANYKLAMNELGMAFEGIKKAIGEAVLPYLTKFADWFTSTAPSLINGMKSIVPALISTVGNAVITMVEGISNFFIAVTENWNKFVSSLKSGKSVLEGAAGLALIASGQAGAGLKMLKDAATHASEAGEPFDVITKRADESRAAVKRTADQMRQFLAEMLSVPDGKFAFKPLPEGTRSAAGLINNKDATGAGMEEMRNRIKLADEAYQLDVNRINTAAKLYDLTEREKTQDLIIAVNDREQKQLSAANAELARGNLTATQRQKVESEITQIVAKATLDRQKLQNQELIHNRTQWEQSLNSIAGMWNSQLRGLLAGTTSWAQAMKNIASSLVIQIIEEFEKLAIIKPLVNSLATIQPPAELFASILKVIMASVGQVFAGVSAFFAPELGPAAPAAAAGVAGAVEASAMSIGKFEKGAWEIPGVMGAILHPREMVLPAGPAGAVRDFFSGGGSGGSDTHVHFNISALDGSSVNRWLRSGGARQIKRGLQGVLEPA